MNIWVLVLILITGDGSVSSRLYTTDDIAFNTKEQCEVVGDILVKKKSQELKDEDTLYYSCNDIDGNKVLKLLEKMK